jgi:hypothetical protein
MMLTNAYNTWEWMVVVLQSTCTKKANPSTGLYSSTVLVVFVQLELDMEIRFLLHTVSSICYWEVPAVVQGLRKEHVLAHDLV